MFVDIGANHGLFSILAIANPRCKAVISVEPCHNNYKILLRNIASQNFSGKAIAMHLALGPSSEIAWLYGGLEGASLKTGWGGVYGTYREEVQVLTLDQLSKLWVDSKSRCLIKIDAEGLEPDILEGAAMTLESGRTAFILELSLDENQQTPNLHQYLGVFELMNKYGLKAFSFPEDEVLTMEIVQSWIVPMQSLGQASTHGCPALQPKRSLNILFRPDTKCIGG